MAKLCKINEGVKCLYEIWIDSFTFYYISDASGLSHECLKHRHVIMRYVSVCPTLYETNRIASETQKRRT